jgi:outer membrane protein
VGIGVVVLSLVAMNAVAQEPKLAVIDVQRVVQESDKGKESIQEIQAMAEEKGQEAQARQQELQQLREQLEKQRLTLSQEKLEQLTQQIQDKRVDLERFNEDAQRELQAAERKMLGRLEQEILPVINEIGNEQGYTMIFNKFQSGLVYAAETVDITDEVIRRYNMSQ